jgi:hypothetical protein
MLLTTPVCLSVLGAVFHPLLPHDVSIRELKMPHSFVVRSMQMSVYCFFQNECRMIEVMNRMYIYGDHPTCSESVITALKLKTLPGFLHIP